MSWETQLRFTDDEWVDPKVVSAIAAPGVREAVSRIFDSLSYEQRERAFDVVRDVLLGKIGLDDVSEALIDRVRVDDEKAFEIDGELYAELFGDIEDTLTKQMAVYAELHPEDRLAPVDAEADPNERIAESVIAKSGLFPADPAMRKRLHGILAAYLKDVRDEAETRVMLEKPPKTGGLGLAPTVAASVLLFVAESKPELERRKGDIVRLRAEAEKARAEAEEMRRKRVAELRASSSVPVPAPAQSVVPTRAEVASFERAGEDRAEDDADIAKIKAALAARGIAAGVRDAVSAPAAPSAAEVAPPKSPLDVAVDETIVALGGTFASEELKTRMKMLVSLYFRDLRDALETTSKFTMPVVSGGMGMEDQDAVKVMAFLKERNATFHAAAREKVKEGKQQFVAERHARIAAIDAEAVARDTSALDKVFSAVTGTSVDAPKTALAAPRAIPVTSIGKTGEQTVVVPKAAPAPVPVSVPAPAPVPVPVPVPASPVPSPLPAPNKPSMADVSGAPARLVGPVEELKALTLKDFRRLSRDPREALLKLRDKIDLLAEQSFEMKTKGIKGWQESEVNAAYLDLLRTSLEGVPVTEVIATREAKGVPSLNKAEFDAIMAFNRDLRFG